MHRQHEQASHKKCMREARKQIKYVNILSNYKRVIICRNVNKKTCKIKSHALSKTTQDTLQSNIMSNDEVKFFP